MRLNLVFKNIMKGAFYYNAPFNGKEGKYEHILCL